MNVEWNFATKTWEAEFVEGALAGKAWQFPISDLSNRRCKKIVSTGLAGAEGDFKDVTELQKKGVCKALMEQWCEAVANHPARTARANLGPPSACETRKAFTSKAH